MTEADVDMAALARTTQAVYERQAARFDAERPKVLIERGWLDRFLDLVPTAGHILDVGCGAGEPVARYLMERDRRVSGLDASSAMLALVRARFPDAVWHRGDMRSFELAERFDGIVAWDSFFHLTRDEQRSVLPRLTRHLAPGGALLLTVGPAEGEVTGHVGGELVYHASLSPEEYREILAAQDLGVVDFVTEDPECDGHTVLLARKAG